MSGTLILPDWLIDIPGEPPKRGWGVRVVGDQIAAVAAIADLRKRYPDDAIIDAAGQTLSPGFVDAHTHLYGVLAHGVPIPHVSLSLQEGAGGRSGAQEGAGGRSDAQEGAGGGSDAEEGAGGKSDAQEEAGGRSGAQEGAGGRSDAQEGAGGRSDGQDGAGGRSDSEEKGGGWSFLTDFWWPLVEDRLDHEMICAATDLNLAQMLRGGTTAFYDITEAPNALPGCLAAQAEVVRARGIRGILSFEATERLSKANGQLGLRENADFISPASTLQPPPSSLVSGFMCFHTTFTCSADFIRQAFEMAAAEGATVHMHAAEGTFEPDYALKHFGLRTFEYYERLGAAGPAMQASQCVQITPAEVDIIARRGVRVTHMPLSNCEVGGGIAPIPDLLSAGVTVGLGSDGYITDMFEIMRGAFLIHKAYRQDTAAMPANVVWRLATEGGARPWAWRKWAASPPAGRPICN